MIMNNMEELKRLYNNNIYEIYNNLKKSNKTDIDNNDLWKIFEYFSCISLMNEYNKIFYQYEDIPPDFKELNNLSQIDTGIDICDLDNTIVQCKLRKNILNWKDCATFFGSQNIYDKSLNKTIIRWNNLIITRNSDSILGKNLLQRQDMFIDKRFSRKEIIEYCENIYKSPPKYIEYIKTSFKLRDYQLESIDVIKNNKNCIICLPTGTGKNSVIIYSIENNIKYLILVPRIILMEQLHNEIIEHKPNLKNKICLLGGSNNIIDLEKDIIICVYNSIRLVTEHINIFKKIYIDEAHHIYTPELYQTEDIDNIENIEDLEDEIKSNSKYIQIIKSFTKYNNNVYLSATIDPIDNFTFYKKEIRDMINNGYLCDYTMHIPIFTEDPTNKNICKYLISNYRNMIIYCDSKKEGNEIYNLLNKLQLKCAEYIDCNTTKTKRNLILTRFKQGELQFLVNVRVLVEGFDAPITKGVCFMHLPSAQTTLIQIIGRALRKHPNKTYANIILPYSTKEDENNIKNFIKIIAKNDSKIRNTYLNKKLGGYINLDRTNMNDNIDEKYEIELEMKYEMIYNSFGELLNGKSIWMNRLNEVKNYIDLHNKRPNKRDDNIEVKKIGEWLSHQVTNYNNKDRIMKDDDVRKKWEEFINDMEYNKYFLDNQTEWDGNLADVKNYIDLFEKRPNKRDSDLEIRKMGIWLCCQVQNYDKKDRIMKDEDIRKKWEEFINDPEYNKYFLDNETEWENILNDLKNYINLFKKRPSKRDNDLEIKKLGKWLSHQVTNYNNQSRNMKNKEIRGKWEEFINDPLYNRYF
jgi:superfamily II DNA or RNA helicase